MHKDRSLCCSSDGLPQKIGHQWPLSPLSNGMEGVMMDTLFTFTLSFRSALLCLCASVIILYELSSMLLFCLAILHLTMHMPWLLNWFTKLSCKLIPIKYEGIEIWLSEQNIKNGIHSIHVNGLSKSCHIDEGL